MRKSFLGLFGLVLVLATGVAAQTQTFKDSQLSIGHMQFTQDGKRLLAHMFNMPIIMGGTDRRELWSWDIASGQLLAQVMLPPERLLFSDAFVLSPDGSLCVSRTGREGQMTEKDEFHLMNTATGELARRLERPQANYVVPLAFTADGRLLIGAQSTIAWTHEQHSAANTLVFWDTRTGKRVLPVQGQVTGPQPVTSTAPGDEHLLVRVPVGIYKEELRVLTLNREAGLTVKEWTLEAERVLQARLSADGRQLAAVLWSIPAAPGTATLMLWDTHTGHRLHSIALGNSYQALHFSPDSREVTVSVAGFFGGTPYTHIRTWNTRNAKLLRTIEPREEKKLSGQIPYSYSTAFSPSGRLLALGASGRGIKLWDVEHDRLLRLMKGSGMEENGWW